MVKNSFQDKTSKNNTEEQNFDNGGSFEEYWEHNKEIWDKDDDTRDNDRDHDHPCL